LAPEGRAPFTPQKRLPADGGEDVGQHYDVVEDPHEDAHGLEELEHGLEGDLLDHPASYWILVK